ncbi:hypothetical protein QO010_002121 [Caulobacter ginsengisoli]|uniref:Spermidine synthase n=1 Tax=Caulobacter ginsengisoli TaxID=400775 RepID=A0ABU0ISE4_9CAUL|nr:fused MFS/spermidine synthase [Caulobacter ginsengisoli]MDQ0464340.1 hypothetical protein [Caulobacter ginsengisoli]
MTTADSLPAAPRLPPSWLFVLAVFSGAAMVFLVEPMVAKLVLPMLGGSPAVWNTSLAFFQAALLAGYGYAHLLQKLKSVRLQALIHLAVLVLAALALPLRVTGALGEPSSHHPALWLLGVLTVSLGAPFAALSATAPLVQSWHARVFRQDGAPEPWALYAASNFGSLLALLAYPILVEPLLGVTEQRLGWSLAYGGFVLLMAVVAFNVRRAAPIPAATEPEPPRVAPVPWLTRLIWIGLAAIPSSLMLGVTAHLTTDVASAPFIWVIPLGLYLITFIIAFQTRPAISPSLALTLQGAALGLCLAIFHASQIEVLLAAHLTCFFLTALICHQALVARRPDTAHLTEFYLCLSIGGVVGGAFNAFLAPAIFNTVLEYPLVLILSCLARPFGAGPLSKGQWGWIALALASAAGAILAVGHIQEITLIRALLAGAAVGAFMLRDRALVFLALIVVLAFASHKVDDRTDVIRTDRSFFGVVRESRTTVPALGGEVRMMAHGTTLHGAQAQDPKYRCRPLVYYAPETPIGQVFIAERLRKPAMALGAVGLGTGSVAAYTRPGDVLTFFEIDPLVIKLASDRRVFSYTTDCAGGQVGYVLGDARLTLAKQAPPGGFDILLIDAFSSDAVPAHLLTVEAMKGYLSYLKPDGLLILHLTNRNLDLRSPAMAVAAAAGGYSLLQKHEEPAGSPSMWESSEYALLVARSPQALARYRADPRWTAGDPTRARAWTDDYSNLISAFYRRLRERMDEKSPSR